MAENLDTMTTRTSDTEERKLTNVIVRLAQVSMPIVLAALIPWGSWITYKVISLDEWKNIAPRFTPRDAEALELRVKTAAVDIYENKVSVIDRKMDAMAQNITELKIMLREHEARTQQTLQQRNP